LSALDLCPEEFKLMVFMGTIELIKLSSTQFNLLLILIYVQYLQWNEPYLILKVTLDYHNSNSNSISAQKNI